MPQNRRSFLGSLAAAAGALVTRDAAAVTAPARQFEPAGVQLYTVRSEMERDLPGTLARVAEIGYREVEFAGYFNRTPAQIRELLAANRLRSPSTHIAFETLGNGFDAVLKSAQEIGHTFVTVPSLPGAARASGAALKETANAFNRAGTEAKSEGLRFAFHNHNIEFAAVDGVEPFTVLVQETDPALVSFQLDVYWAFRAGRDPLTLLRAHPQRISMLHLKDSAGPPAHAMVEVGAGVIDWRAILTQSRANGVRHFFVEHDRPADAIASIRTSFTNLTSLPR
jgi:sugar phosphate isomerase/epimerase